MTKATAPAKRQVRVVSYQGSVAYLNGQMMKVVGWDAATNRYTLETITGDRLENVRRQSFVG